MSDTADRFVYESSLESQVETDPFISREMA